MITTNADSQGQTVVAASGNPTETANPSATASSFWDGFRDFASGFQDLFKSADQALTNAGIITAPVAPKNSATSTAKPTDYKPLLLAAGAIILAVILFRRR